MIKSPFSTGGQVFWWLTFGLVLLNFLQAGFTDLDPDEAYYWVYAQDLAFGYFDHPLAVALLISIGSTLFDNEFGVRFMTVLFQVLTFSGMWVLVGKPSEKKESGLFFLLLAAMPMLQVYGFITTPDVPLLACAVWYLVWFVRFVDNPSWRNTLILAFLMAALLYSKYHGVVWIGLIGLSHFGKLIRMPRFFLAALGGVVLFLPHLYWQYTHGFPSFRYHLSGRDDAYEIKYTITYVINQLIIFSPFVLPMMLWAVRKGKLPKEEAVMYSWLLIGFWVFFFLMSFKGHVEPQWTVLLSIPLVAWTYSYARQSAAFARWLQRMCYVSIGFLIIARVLLIIPVGELLRDFHKKEWVFALENEVDNGKVVFSNSYRDPSMYYFYSGQRTTQFTDIYYRANQYDLWPWEEDLHGKDITLAGKRNWDCSECLLKNVGGKDFRMKEIKDLQVSQKVDFTFEVKTSTPDSIFIQITLVNPYPFIIVPARGNMALLPGIMFLQNGILQTFEPLHSYPDIWAAEQSLTFTSRIAKPKNLSGTFTLLPGIKTGDLPPAKNSFQPVTFEL